MGDLRVSAGTVAMEKSDGGTERSAGMAALYKT